MKKYMDGWKDKKWLDGYEKIWMVGWIEKNI